MAAVTLTKHAEQRMHERGITRHDVIRVLAFGEQIPTPELAVYRSCIQHSSRREVSAATDGVDDIVVVYRQGDGSPEYQVVTTYRPGPTPRS